MYDFSPFLKFYSNQPQPVASKSNTFLTNCGKTLTVPNYPNTLHVGVSLYSESATMSVLTANGRLQVFKFRLKDYRSGYGTFRLNSVCRNVCLDDSCTFYIDKDGQALMGHEHLIRLETLKRFDAHWNNDRPPSDLIGQAGVMMAVLADGNFIARPPHSHSFNFPALQSLAKYCWRPLTSLNELRDNLFFQCLAHDNTFGSVVILCNKEKTRSRLIAWGGVMGHNGPFRFPQMTILYDTADSVEGLVFLYAFATRDGVWLLTNNYRIYLLKTETLDHVLDLLGPPEFICVFRYQSINVFMPNGQQYRVCWDMTVTSSVQLPVQHPSPMAWLVPEETLAWWSVWVQCNKKGGILGNMPRDVARLIAGWLWTRPHPPRGLSVVQMPLLPLI